jgi:hypothetical protein
MQRDSGSSGAPPMPGQPVRGPWKLSLESAQVKRQHTAVSSGALCVDSSWSYLLVRRCCCCLRAPRQTGLPRSLMRCLRPLPRCVLPACGAGHSTHSWSLFGQAVVLAVIQVGGFGFMTSANPVASSPGTPHRAARTTSGRRDHRCYTPGWTRATHPEHGIVDAVCGDCRRACAPDSFRCEGGFGHGLWKAVFQSVSSFNNAGFDIFGDFVSLTELRGDAVVVVTTALLLITGGLATWCLRTSAVSGASSGSLWTRSWYSLHPGCCCAWRRWYTWLRGRESGHAGVSPSA